MNLFASDKLRELMQGISNDENSRNESNSKTYWANLSFGVTVIMSMIDILTDILFLLYVWKIEKVDFGLKIGLIVFLVIPFLSNIYLASESYYDTRNKSSSCRWPYFGFALHYILVLTRIAYFPTFISRRTYITDYEEEDLQKKLSVVIMYETILESIPQLILQSIITSQLGQLTNIYYVSVTVSSVMIIYEFFQFISRFYEKYDASSEIFLLAAGFGLLLVLAFNIALIIMMITKSYYSTLYEPTNPPGSLSIYTMNGGCSSPVKYSSHVGLFDWKYSVKCYDNSTLEYIDEGENGDLNDCSMDFSMFSKVNETLKLSGDHCNQSKTIYTMSMMLLVSTCAFIVMPIISFISHVNDNELLMLVCLIVTIASFFIILVASVVLLVEEDYFKEEYLQNIVKELRPVVADFRPFLMSFTSLTFLIVPIFFFTFHLMPYADN